MQRGVYFDGWFPRQHCYHPSLPPRRLAMIDDLVEYGATMLVWSALGGGSISLPYLEQEAWQDIPERFRLYGFLNDAEFIEACGERGIDVYGIVFEVQGWEFPAELSDDGERVLALNELRGVGKPAWLGLREFTQNTHPQLWKSFESYFPDGLVNSDGEQVTDLLEECVSRDIDGNALHSTWVECPDRSHYCYLMDRNNPVWREYLKAIIKIQIDAGVQGVQLDEADLPYFANGYGGCFCKDCVKQFREYLAALPEAERPAELADVDLEKFDYGAWLKAQGYDFKANQSRTPLFFDYRRFQRTAITRYFKELVDYARSYAASIGREIKVSGNFYSLSPHYYAFAPFVDVLITETNEQSFRQPEWNRYSAGFAGDTSVVAVENPYGGVVPNLSERLKRGRGHDQFRMMQYEAAALGINMSIPYGAWMGSVINDAFTPPHELCVEVSRFLKDNERLYSTRTYSENAVLFSVESTYLLEAKHVDQDQTRQPFWEVLRRLTETKQPYDVVVLPEGVLRADTITAQELSRYRNIVLPEIVHVTAAQLAALRGYLDGGGNAVVTGQFGTNLSSEDRSAVLSHPRVIIREHAGEFSPSLFAGGPQLQLQESVDIAFNIHAISDKEAALHFIRYDYDEERDEVPVLDTLTIDLRLGSRPFRSASAVSPDGRLKVDLDARGVEHRIVLHDVGVYGVVLLQG